MCLHSQVAPSKLLLTYSYVNYRHCLNYSNCSAVNLMAQLQNVENGKNVINRRKLCS